VIKDIIKVQSRTLLICIAIAFALYMTAAWRSAIYLHPDEYYQIVEFASYKMHITQPDQMAWEFGEKIRPSFQPLMCYCFLKGFNSIHITDHYTQLHMLRVLSALLSLFSITLFCLTGLPLISDRYRRVYIIATYLFWYPYTYGVHFSSETWSGCTMLIAISLTALYYLNERKKSLLFFAILGCLIGIAFLLRFQTAFLSLGILAWIVFQKKERSNVFIVVLAGMAMLALGTVADHWFYGEWLCSPWRYVDLAFIHKHLEFGSKPFYFYALLLTLMLTPPIGLLIVVSVLAFFYTQPRSLYTWALLPFLLLHTIIGHKEFRFMYPVMSLFPLAVVLAYQGLREKGLSIPRWALSITKSFVIMFNVLCLVIFVVYSNRFLFDSKVFCAEIHEMAKTKKVIVYYNDVNNSPFILPKATIPRDLFPEYMRDKNIHEVAINDIKEVGPSNQDTIKLIATNQYEYKNLNWPHKATNMLLRQTLTDLSFVRNIVGDDVYKGISDNTYYLIESK
jgi:phosphatidylinositol glycan class B